MRSLTAFTESFLAFERDEKLFAVDLKGHAFWAYLRYAVFYEILNGELHYIPVKRTSRLKRATDALRAVAAYTGDVFRKATDYDVLLINYDRRKLIDGKYVNLHTYPISKHLASKYKVAVLDFYDWTVGRAGYPCDAISLRHLYLYARAQSLTLPYTRGEQDVVADITARIEKAFGVKVDLWALTREVYFFQILLCREFLKVLRACRPQMLGYCDTANLQGVTEAAHRAGVPTVDFQHSLISHLNVLYNYPSDCLNGPLPSMSDYIFSFGGFWASEFRLPARIMTAGFPYFDQEYARAARESHADRDRHIILIADEYSRREFVAMAVKLAELLPDHRIYYKLRPEEYASWKERYPAELQTIPNLTMIDHDDVSLYQYFAMCRYQVGTNSTALFEGMPFGLITFILKAGWYEEMRRVYDGQGALLVSNADDIAEAIRTGVRPGRPIPRQELFAENSLERTEHLIDRILTKSV